MDKQKVIQIIIIIILLLIVGLLTFALILQVRNERAMSANVADVSSLKNQLSATAGQLKAANDKIIDLQKRASFVWYMYSTSASTAHPTHQQALDFVQILSEQLKDINDPVLTEKFQTMVNETDPTKEASDSTDLIFSTIESMTK